MPNSSTATFVISIDLEMSWGAVHHGHPHRTTPYESEREIVTRLLDLMHAHGISATWAIVGHLFLTSCSPLDGRKHPEINRPQYGWYDIDWYRLDPATSVAQDPTWYGPDLVEMVGECPTDQEIGSHSFGHIIAGDPDCDEQAFESDLEACLRVAASAGITLSSYVYPRNSIGHLELLERHGFTAYRGTPEVKSSPGRSMRGKLDSIARVFFPERHEPAHARRFGNMVNVPQTYLFDPDSKTAQRLGTGLWSTLVKRRLTGAIQTESLFHLWFHTHNLANNPDQSFKALDDLFAAARRAIENGRLENLTMSQVADRLIET